MTNVIDLNVKKEPEANLMALEVFGKNRAGDSVELCRWRHVKSGATSLLIVLFSREGASEAYRELASCPDNESGLEYCRNVGAVAGRAVEYADLNAEELEGRA